MSHTKRADGAREFDADTLSLIRCPRCRQGLVTHGTSVACVGCAAEYPVRYGILDLRVVTADAHKARQAQFFSEEAVGYERDVVNSPFYQALDAITVGRWCDSLPSGSRVMDIGSGTGRVAIALASAGHRVIAIDLTEPLLRQASDKAARLGLSERIAFVQADAEGLPVEDASLDGAVCHGVLHHLEAPQTVIAQAGRALRPGGRWFSLDPHRSPARGVFDAAMRWRTLWQEEAAADGLQTERRLRGWCESAAIEPAFGYSCFILPHLLTPWPRGVIRWLLAASDGLFGRSALRKLGGVIFVSGRKRLAPSEATPARRGLPASAHLALLAVLGVVAAASGAWRPDPDVAARSAQYYMGGLNAMLDTAAAADRQGVTFITHDGAPLEGSTLDDVGYIVALQLASLTGLTVDEARLAAVHAFAYTAAAVLFAWAIAARYRSSVAGIAALVALLALGTRLSMLIYGQVSNQSATSIFPPLVLAALVAWSGRYRHQGSAPPSWRDSAALGALVAGIDLVRHSHGLATMIALAFVVLVGLRGLRPRLRVAGALAAGYLVVMFLIPAGLKLHRDIRLDAVQTGVWNYLARPPAHHISYTLLTAVGRYPNPLGLYYEDRSVDDYIMTHAPWARGEAARVDAARGLLVDYARGHTRQLLSGIAKGAAELGPFVAYVSFMAPRRWEYAWPDIVPGLAVAPRDVARYGKNLLMGFRASYLRLSVWAWGLLALAAVVLVGALLQAMFAVWRGRAPDLALVAALLYLVWVALPRALVPVQGMDFVVAFWCVAVLCAIHLVLGGAEPPFEPWWARLERRVER